MLALCGDTASAELSFVYNLAAWLQQLHNRQRSRECVDERAGRAVSSFDMRTRVALHQLVTLVSTKYKALTLATYEKSAAALLHCSTCGAMEPQRSVPRAGLSQRGLNDLPRPHRRLAARCAARRLHRERGGGGRGQRGGPKQGQEHGGPAAPGKAQQGGLAQAANGASNPSPPRGPGLSPCLPGDRAASLASTRRRRRSDAVAQRGARLTRLSGAGGHRPHPHAAAASRPNLRGPRLAHCRARGSFVF